MRSFKFIVGILVASFCLEAFAGSHKSKSVTPLLNAICMKESSGGTNRKDGDKGKAIGDYQIWYQYWYDATHDAAGRQTMGGSYQDCRKHEYAEAVILAYWQRYCPDALTNLDYEVLARVHNGGPLGHKKPATKRYWSDVQKFLN